MKILVFILLTQLLSCAPTIHIIERQTILEEESSASWPDFEKKLLEATTRPGASFLPEVHDSKQRDEVYRTLNGEMVTTTTLNHMQVNPHEYN